MSTGIFMRLRRNNYLCASISKNIKNDSMDNQQPEQPQQQINIELSEEMADGTYANLAIITHSFAEFVIDFANVMPGVPKAKVKSRVVMTPQHAKRLMRALIDNIKRYEAQNGVIKDQEQPNGLPFTFGGPAAEA
jgi:hypothetical protein